MSFYARINLTEDVLYDIGKMELLKLSFPVLKIVTKEVKVNEEGDTEPFTFLYSYITKEQYQKLERHESGYWICPVTKLSGSLELLDKIWVR